MAVEDDVDFAAAGDDLGDYEENEDVPLDLNDVPYDLVDDVAAHDYPYRVPENQSFHDVHQNESHYDDYAVEALDDDAGDSGLAGDGG